MTWMHINFWFNGGQDLDESKNKRMRQYIASLCDHLDPYIKRFYYLYEDNPHLYLALELKDKCYNGRIIEILTDHYRPQFIKRVTNRFETNEASNGDLFLNILSSYCKSIVSYSENIHIQQPGRIKGLTKLHHITHCIFDMIFGSRKEEIKFYKKQLSYYGKAGRTVR